MPLLTVPLYAGAVADAVDRRLLLLWSDVALALVSVVLLVNALADEPSVPLLFVAEALSAAAYGFQRPARNALTPARSARAADGRDRRRGRRLQPRSRRRPRARRVLIAAFGLAGAYGLDVATFTASLISIWLLPRVPVVEGVGRPGFHSILEGVRYVRRRHVLLGILLVDTNAMIFGMPSALFPAFAEEIGRGPEIVGLLYAAPYAGAFAASVLVRVDRARAPPGARHVHRGRHMGRRDRRLRPRRRPGSASRYSRSPAPPIT